MNHQAEHPQEVINLQRPVQADVPVVVTIAGKSGSSKGVHKVIKLVNIKQPKGMIELFSKQGVSVPITTTMVLEAYQHVKQGGEAAGIDGMTWEYLHSHRSQLLYQLWARLASGSYFPKAIRAVSIPKKDGSKRVLGLPTLLDRIARASSKGSLREVLRTTFSSELIWV